MKIRLTGETFIALSVYLLGFYLCLPISMVFLNSVFIYIITFSAAFFFIVWFHFFLLSDCLANTIG